jgi:ABC-type multidrug transport system fused ATPase/permease subunit
LPNGEETIIGNRGVRLSGGERQRVGIARALYNNPRVLVLDEATSSLDVENEQKIMNEIFSASQSKTLIIITHRHQTVQNCDTVFLLDNGKLVDQGEYAYLNKKFNLNTFIKSKQSKG